MKKQIKNIIENNLIKTVVVNGTEKNEVTGIMVSNNFLDIFFKDDAFDIKLDWIQNVKMIEEGVLSITKI